jgi:hypothetical protein
MVPPNVQILICRRLTQTIRNARGAFALSAAEILLLKGERAMNDPHKRLSELGRAHLISGVNILFGNDEFLVHHMFSHKEAILRCPAKILINEASKFQPEDLSLLRCALDFWNGRGSVRLVDLLSSFSHKEWTQFVLAICHLEEIKADVHEALARDL